MLKMELNINILQLLFEYIDLYIYFLLLFKNEFNQEQIRKKFCEEKDLRSLLGVFGHAESKSQCWQAEKWRLYFVIYIFPRWPPNCRGKIKICRVT